MAQTSQQEQSGLSIRRSIPKSVGRLAPIVLVVAAGLVVCAAADKGQSPAASRATAANVRSALVEVSFSGGRDIGKDDESGSYSAPHWRDVPAIRSPYLMQAGETLTIANAKVRVFGRVSGPLMIRGWREDGRDIPPTQASRVAGTTDLYEISNVKAKLPFAANTAAFFDTFDLDWQVSLDSGRTWSSAGVSKNPVYVSLAANTLPASPPRTVVHLAGS